MPLESATHMNIILTFLLCLSLSFRTNVYFMKAIIIILIFFSFSLHSQYLTPEQLWSLGRVTGLGISKDNKHVVYAVRYFSIPENKGSNKYFTISISDGQLKEITDPSEYLQNTKISKDGKNVISHKEVKIKKVFGNDFYNDLPKSNVQIYESLNYRHWDSWEDGKFDHVILSTLENGLPVKEMDLMQDEPFDCPQKPFGGDEDYIWHPAGKKLVYVTKKKYGTDYAISTNTDLYQYDLETGITSNLTDGMKGYDINPAYNQLGELAWLSMKRDGYESDKQDIIVTDGITKQNLTGNRDDIHVEGFIWGNDNKTIFFWAAKDGTMNLFKVNYPGKTKMGIVIDQLTKGDFDINGIVGQVENKLIVSRTDMNRAPELYILDMNSNTLSPLTHVNDEVYKSIGTCKTEKRYVSTTDGKKMLVWVIYPPDFDASKKYPALLFCQGGPQVSLTQSYSFRWNFQLMASQGYIVVAPNRRGMPGHGTKWNEQVSKDWGGQVMRDHLSAIDAVSKENYIDKKRLGCVGASFGGYAVFQLAGMHNNRFKTFIAHDGIFDFRSMYGSTEELFFENWEKGGAYWEKSNAIAQRSFSQSPSNSVQKWNTPMLIFHGGKDYRVPYEQGLQAFTALQLKRIKSRFVYLPDQNHWVLSVQDALVWQREFYKWLQETL